MPDTDREARQDVGRYQGQSLISTLAWSAEASCRPRLELRQAGRADGILLHLLQSKQYAILENNMMVHYDTARNIDCHQPVPPVLDRSSGLCDTITGCFRHSQPDRPADIRSN